MGTRVPLTPAGTGGADSFLIALPTLPLLGEEKRPDNIPVSALT